MKYTQSYKWVFSFSTWKVHFFLAVYPLYDLNSINECTAVSCCFISASWLSVCRSNGVGHLIHISALCITNRWSGPLSRRKVASGSGGPTAGARLGLGFSAQLNPYYLVIFNPSAGIDCCPSNANIICTYSYVLSPIRPIYIHIYLLLCYLLLYFLLRHFGLSRIITNEIHAPRSWLLWACVTRRRFIK